MTLDSKVCPRGRSTGRERAVAVGQRCRQCVEYAKIFIDFAYRRHSHYWRILHDVPEALLNYYLTVGWLVGRSVDRSIARLPRLRFPLNFFFFFNNVYAIICKTEYAGHA